MMCERMCFGDWVKSGALGYGTFGAVCLWENRVTHQKLAIKMCRPDLELSQKNQQRWRQEIHILMQIKHPNVIRALQLPESLKTCFEGHSLPALCMEYCEGGDLRKTLSTVENCCGVNLNMITKVCKHISCAIECLHSLGIAHRDLKPENIVICRSENKNIIFKVIDLGYAKQLDPSNSQHSHVGTPHYLAPEILMGSKSYKINVDYWSFGCLLYECCTGIRPFDVVSSKDNLNSIVNKEPKYISAFVDEDCQATVQLKFCDTLPEVNQLNSVIQCEFENLLRLVLDGCPEQRGGNTRWLQCIQEIISSKIISVFCIDCCSEYTYKFTPDLSALQMAIYKDTGIEQENQELFLIDGNCLSGQQMQPNKHVFLFNKNFKLANIKKCRSQVPNSVDQLLQDPTTFVNKSLKHHIEVYRHSVHFAQKQRYNNCSMTRALKALIIDLLKSRQHLLDETSKVQENVSELKATIEFFKLSLAFDLQNYQQTWSGVSKEHKSMVESWQGIDDQFEQNQILLKAEKMFQVKGKLQDEITTVRSQDQISQAPKRCVEHIHKRVQDIQAQYNEIKKPTGNSSCWKERVEELGMFLEQFIDEIDDMNEQFYKCFIHVVSLRKRLAEFLLEIKQLDNCVTQFKDDIKLMQGNRQNDIWKLLSKQESVAGSSKMKRDKSFYKRSSIRIMTDNQALVSKMKETLETLKEQEEIYWHKSQELDWSFLQCGS